MKHYPHHISDFNNATRHLTRVERSLYRDLIELYYETEQPLPSDVGQVCRRILANELSTDVERMLNEFFVHTPQGWYHVRCDEEISKYQGNNSQRAQAGKASAAKKALKKQQALNGKSTSVEIPLNENSTGIHNQSTNQPINHKPKEEKSAVAPHLLAIPEKLLSEFLEVRKAKRAGKLTDTALKGLEREGQKAGLTLIETITACIEYGWQSFNAGWYAERNKPRAQTAVSATKYAGAAAAIFQMDEEFIDV